ncbi:hypothetical protein GUI37_03720 [Helcococcus kunzii]|uniref:hypothetical protein n=1 Tax=Helcococcus kunzii TaxID=40091 RepID=UPI001BAF84F1|nr:hypothetical protein [Helcococcus kunzii]QUY64661.1 hypothetical protein GUI37_03720 [Helcococcus kunzii]
MKKSLKLFVLVILCVIVFGYGTDAFSTHRTVRYNSTADISETGSNWKKIRVFYDHGTPAIGDNARLFGTSVNNTRNYVGMRYANFDSGVFNEKRTLTKGEKEAYLNYNPIGVDHLKPGSFVQSEGVVSTVFWMQLKVTK